MLADKNSGYAEHLRYIRNENTHSYCYDARGNGGGSIAPTITGDHQNRITDYTAVVVKTYEDINGKTVL